MCAEHVLQCCEVVLGVLRHGATVDLSSVGRCNTEADERVLVSILKRLDVRV